MHYFENRQIDYQDLMIKLSTFCLLKQLFVYFNFNHQLTVFSLLKFDQQGLLEFITPNNLPLLSILLSDNYLETRN